MQLALVTLALSAAQVIPLAPRLDPRVGIAASDARTAAALGISLDALAAVRAWRPATNSNLLALSPQRWRRVLQQVFAPRPDRPDQAAAWRAMFHAGSDGGTPPNALLDARAAFEAMRTEGIAGGLDSTRWTAHGPGNIGGRIRSIAIDPRNGARMFVGSVSGGIWRTTDGGARWSKVNDLLENLAVTSIVIDPASPDVMYAATGEGFWEDIYVYGTMLPGVRGAGVFKSTDGGSTWSQIALTATADYYWVHRLAVAPTGGALLAATASGLYRTTNQGLSWTRVHQASANARYYDVDFHPTDGQRAVAQVKNFAAGAWTSRVLYSTDGGQNWTNSDLSVASNQTTGRIELAYHRGYTGAGGGCVYACADQANGTLYRSTDGGQTFGAAVATPGHMNGIGWYVNALWVDPSDRDADTANDRLIVGALDLHRSVNGGSTWTQISLWSAAPATSAHADHHCIVEQNGFDWGNAANRRVFFANDGGIYKTDDASTVGQTTGWTALNNDLAITQFYGGARAPNGTLHGGTQDNGTLRSTATAPWATTFGGDGGFVACDQLDANYVYGEYVSAQIFRSADGGSTAEYIDGQHWNGTAYVWKAAPYRIEDARNGAANFIAPFILDPNDQQRLLVGGVSLWRTTEARRATTATTGPTWRAIKGPAAGNPNISAIAVAKRRPDVIWVGHNDGKLFSTADGTAAAPTWTARGAGMPARVVTRITIDDADADRIFVTYGGFANDNIWVSNDAGATFASLSTGALAVPVRDLEIHPAAPAWLYAATEVGLLVSENNGATWTSTATPANVAIDELFIGGNRIHLVTHGRGMFSQGDFNLVRNLGGGCRHPNTPGGPTLGTTPPLLGTTMTLSVTGAPPNSVGIVLLTVAPTFPIPWTPSCTLHVFGPLPAIQVALFIGGTGSAVLPIPIPGNPSLAGAAIVMQAVVVELPLLNLHVTNGLQAVLGG